ncbi:PREDICTED: graves disease carrier protein-like [Dinoponera quadriceps]|uniref:Graves disease carrier protein-like n=1 Tax=Dinoponera quadriceps TaxID=609295 RepID=A0A6P3X7V5_DINQU|nr:PREDICTED: graves disease carrier protein-like [Dinoponera quadriceps]XP_014474486.1 PREDICTED: graves disease carrier protein-like [Dinoponera quadriceps]
MPQPDEKGKTPHIILKNLMAGGVAGMCSKTAVAPLDRIKILLQAQHKHYRHLGVFSGLKHIIQSEGFCALYKGNFVQMIRVVPYAAGQFTAYEMYKKHLGGSFGQHSHIDRFLAGAAGGVTAATITYPLDMIRARLAFLSNGDTIYTGISDVAIKIFRQEGGFRALYRGYLPNVIAMVPYAGLSFYTYEKLKYLCMKRASNYFCSKREANTGGLVLNVFAKLLCGGVAGAVAHTVSYPLDVTKRRMQLAMMHPATYKYGSGMWSTMRMIYIEDGVMRGLYRGMTVNFLRSVPFVAVGFTSYEIMRQMLDLDTGMKV